jgi:hypothetical protein
VGQNWLLLIPIVALVLFVVGPIAVLRAQKRALPAPTELGSGSVPPAGASTGFQQASTESREEFVRRYWQRSGVVANGETLVDLYDRIRALEARVAIAEQHRPQD